MTKLQIPKTENRVAQTVWSFENLFVIWKLKIGYSYESGKQK